MQPLRLRPFAPSPPGRYSRLFPPDDAVATLAQIECLAGRMDDKDIPRPAPLPRLIPAGYTYFGQLIDHDLTIESRAHAPGAEPHEIENLRGRWLELESIYGEGPASACSRDLYEADGCTFRLGEVTVDGTTFDVPLAANTKRPLLAESRNAENAFVRQVHAMFLKLHNAAVSSLPPGWPPEQRFQAARERVCHVYQWLVRKDFLKRVCDPEVYEEVIGRGLRKIDWGDSFSIPVEFARATFRFGHSMVRADYTLHGEERVPLSAVFGSAEMAGALRPELAVPWTGFLHENPARPQFAMLINTSIVPALFRLPPPSARLSGVGADDRTMLRLPHLTLMRGATSRLPCGEAVRDALQERPPRTRSQPYDPWKDLKECGLREQTPLWYFILLEAEIEHLGSTLGPVGSRLVAEVIEGALRANKNSYLSRKGETWRPEPWSSVNGRAVEIETLHDVAVIVGLADATS